MDEILKDKRFAHIPRDPAFKRVPRREQKVKIDKRFQSMFSDKRFKVKYTVDKRGKPTQNSSTENLRRYYALDSSSESEEDSSNDEDASVKKLSKSKGSVKFEKSKSIAKGKGPDADDRLTPVKEKVVRKSSKSGKKVRDSESSDDTTSFQRNTGNRHKELEESSGPEDDSDSDFSQDEGNDELDIVDHNFDAKIRARLQDLSVDYARGEGIILSDSSSDEESSDEEEYEDNVDHGWGELDQDAERTDESTHRLAVCNMDWDRIRASDLMVLLNSFLPKGGFLHSVTVYPSEYGLQRMKEEEEKGPLELRAEGDATVEDSDDPEDGKKKKARDDDEVEEGSQYQREKLRQYQLNRLRYYYAVVVCDSVKTADVVYKECDGMEYESSASHMDLRFIPDGTTFDQPPRETCTVLPNMKKYEPQLFITTALQQSKVRLTWDETDPRRLKFNEKVNSGKVDEVDDHDLKVYLATSSSEGESGDEEDKEKEESAAKYRALLQSIEEKEEEKKQQNMEMEVTWGIDLKQKVEKRLKDGKADELTPFQKYMQKRKEKKKAKREEQLKKKQQFKESAEETAENSASEDDVPSDIDMNDDYFKEEFETEEFAHTKKKESKNKKNKKKKKGDESEDEETKRKKAELELLLMDEEDNKKHFSLKDILVEDTKSKKKKKKMKSKEESTEKQVDDFEINVGDSRFSALFTSHLYNIDPADPHYKKTKGMEALRQEKLNRRDLDEEVPTKRQKVETPDKRKDPELSLLVKNVKRKAQTLKK